MVISYRNALHRNALRCRFQVTDRASLLPSRRPTSSSSRPWLVA